MNDLIKRFGYKYWVGNYFPHTTMFKNSIMISLEDKWNWLGFYNKYE